MDVAEYRKLTSRAHQNKFHAQKETVDGITFDSKAEAKRYHVLRMLQRAGQIRDLSLQPSWDLMVKGVKIGVYTADFRYIETILGKKETLIVEDIKSPITAAQKDYRLRVKLWKAIYPGINFRELTA